MSAYLVVFARINDRARFIEEYAKPAAALVAAMGGEYLVRSPKTAALEGDWGAGWSSVISKWPDRAAIDRFWRSPDYERLKAARASLAECRIMIVEDP
jgi:uncharacterized protein (DUF1330 family)